MGTLTFFLSKMNFFLLLSLIPAVLSSVCPGSPASLHASCNMTVDIKGTCDNVKAEIMSRVNGEGGWYDPHNRGTYKLVKDSQNYTEFSRLTGDKKYTDLMDFTFIPVSDTSCTIVACSESQVTSLLDFSTNFCNLHDLYCGTAAGCKIVKYDFVFDEHISHCTQHDTSSCLKVSE